MLFTTADLGEHISGVILFDETIRQSTEDGVPFVKVLEAAGSIPGIKVDTGAKPLALFPGETVTEGLDGLRERLAAYRELGARFAKWRATIIIGDGTPTSFAIDANAHAMARYAALCQEAEIVPIVEPEILMDGDHPIAACEEATGRTLDALYKQMVAHRLDLPGTLLKVNMVVPGKANAVQDDDADDRGGDDPVPGRARATHRARDRVPVRWDERRAGDEPPRRDEPDARRGRRRPWALSFSYGRALQAPALRAWGGDPRNVAAGQRALAHRATMNGRARDGAYDPAMESAA